MITIKSRVWKARRQDTDQHGDMNVLVIPLILLIFFFGGAAAFGFWAFSEREDYRTKAEQKISAAIKVAKAEQSADDTKANDEANKQPLKTYIGPEAFGSVRVMFPKTWSGYVIDTGTSNAPLDGYFHPGVVPSTTDQTSTFGLRVSVSNQSYAAVVKQYTQQVTTKALTSSAYALPKVPSVVGIRYEGAIKQGKKITGSMIVLPLRDKTLQVWTESPIYYNDFNTYILPNLSFSP